MTPLADWLLVAMIAVLLGIEVFRMTHGHHGHNEHGECKCHVELEEIRAILAQILAFLQHPLPTGGTLTQIGDDGMPTNNSIVVGTTGVFQVTPTPPGSAVPAADVITFAASDPSITIAVSPDADPTKVMVGAPAGSTLTSFQLACQFTGADFPTPVNATPITVSVTPAAAPLPTGGTIAQLS